MFVTLGEVLDEANSGGYEAISASTTQNFVNWCGDLVNHVDVLDSKGIDSCDHTMFIDLLLVGVLLGAQDQVREFVTVGVLNSVVVSHRALDAVRDV
jgi:hypothetical protein